LVCGILPAQTDQATGRITPMSKHEKPLIDKFWDRIGGTIVYEFPMTKRTPKVSTRLLDALIIPSDEKKVSSANDVEIKNKEIIIIQAKANRLGMNVLGQAFFSRELMKKFKPDTIRCVVICKRDDEELHQLADQFNIEVEF
jgi:hypothetical protein